MKRVVPLALVLSLLAPATALAKHAPPSQPYVPPNQSAASQYTEDVPTAGGDVSVSSVTRPSRGKHLVLAGHGAGSGGSGGSSISSSTLKAMSASGASGSAAASLAAALAPATPATPAPPAPHKVKTSSSQPPRKPTVLTSVNVPAERTSSAAYQVVDSLTGAGGGLGGLLPVILVGSLVLASGAGIVRIFRPGSPS